MKKFRIDPLVSIVRIFKEPIDCECPLHSMVNKYYKTMTLEFIDNGDVRVTNVIESPTIKESKDVFKELAELGYKKVTWKHNSKEHKVNLNNYRRLT